MLVIEQLDGNYNKFSSFFFARCLTKATPLINSPYSCENSNICEAVNSCFFLCSKSTISFPSFNMTTNSCVLPRETAAKKPMVNKLNLTSKCKDDLKNLTRKSGLKKFSHDHNKFRAILYFNGKLLRQFLGKINSKDSSLAKKGRHSLEVPRSSRNWMAE